GAMIGWNIAIPLYSIFGETDPVLATAIAAECGGIGSGDAECAAWTIWSQQVRYLGVGAMLIGGVWTLISLRSSLLSGIKTGLVVARAGGNAGIAHTERDLPMKAILIGLVLFTLPLLALYQAIV